MARTRTGQRLISAPLWRGLTLGTLLLLILAGPRLPGPTTEPEHACRFYGMIGSAPIDSVLDDHLLTGTYAFKLLAASNSDGWGLGYTSATLQSVGLTRPAIRRGGPRADHGYDLRFNEAVGEMLSMDATCAVLHVRAASSGHADAPDPHPFMRDGLVFVHNGTVQSEVVTALLEADDPAYLAKHPTDYEAPQIDSELYFLYILKLWTEGIRGEDGRPRDASLEDALAEAILQIYDNDGLGVSGNCLLASPDTLFALRFDSSDHDRYRVRYTKQGGAWIVASEPVGTDTTGWFSLPPKSMGVFTARQAPQIIPIYPPSGPWLALESTTIDDDQTGLSFGNGDGRVDAGERLELWPVLRNDGNETALQVSASLTTADTSITIISGLTAYDDLPPGASGVPLTPPLIDIHPDTPGGHTPVLSLQIAAEDAVGTEYDWARTLGFYVRAPEFALGEYMIDDDEDGLLEPGESADLWLWIENSGDVEATGIDALLESSSPYVQIDQAAAGLDTLLASEVGALTPPMQISLDAGCPNPQTLPFTVHLTADYGIADSVSFDIPVGGFVDHMEQGDGNWTHETLTPGFSDAWHLSTQRNRTPGGSTAWKCGSPDSGQVYPVLLDAALVTPILPLAEQFEIRFWHWIRAQTSLNQFGYARDGGLVEVSINSGPWQVLYPQTGYDYLIDHGDPPGPFPNETPAFSGYYLWRQAICAIEGYAGTIQIRFRFGSDGDDGTSTSFEGWYIDDVQMHIHDEFSDVPQVQGVPLKPALLMGGPNPFREETTIIFEAATAGPVSLRIVDLEGRVLRNLIDGPLTAGRHRIKWDGRDRGGRPLPSGLYFYHLISHRDGFSEVRRIIRLQ